MGDSLTALAINGSFVASGVEGRGTDWNDRSYAGFLRRFMGSRIDLPASRVFAELGYTTAQILSTFLAPCAAARPDWCIVEAGVNDIFNNVPPATTIANLKLIYSVLVNSGIVVIALPIRSTGAPQPGYAALSPAQRRQLAYINNEIKSLCNSSRGMTYVDVNPQFIDFSNGEAQPSFILDDGVHDSPRGAIVTAQVIRAFLNAVTPPRDDRFILASDTYDPVENPTGNLIPNGLMADSQALPSPPPSGASGVTPTGWSADPSLGTVAFSKTSYPNLLNLTKATMTLSGSWASGRTPGLSNSTTTNFAAGDTVVAEIEADWEVTSGINSIGIAVYFQNGGNLLAAVRDGFDSGNGIWPTKAGSAVFRTEPFVVPASTNIIVLNALVFPAEGVANAVVHWARASLRKTY